MNGARALLDDATLERLAAIYLVANTPSFLHQQFVQSSDVQTLSRYSVDQIKAALLGSLRNKTRTMLDDVAVYACLAALTYKQREELTVLNDLPEQLTHLKWGRKLFEIAKNSTRSDTFERIKVLPNVLTVSEQKKQSAYTIDRKTLEPATILQANKSVAAVTRSDVRTVEPHATD